jgi:L-fuconolactonase
MDDMEKHGPGMQSGGINRRDFIRNSALGSAGMLTLGIGDRDDIQNIVNVREDVMIIDAHCHAWPFWPYKPEVPDPQSRGAVEQLINQMDLWGVSQATIVSAQIDHNPSNNQYVADAVRKYPGRLYQYADVDSVWSKTYHTVGAASRMEAAIETFHPKGFTHYLSEEDNGDWFNTPDGIDFCRVAAEGKLIASISCSPKHHPALRKLAERFPAMPVLCHHLSGLKSSEKSSSENLREVLTSASLPNIYLKLSGFAYVTNGNNKGEYPYADTRWIYKACYERYGQRMVWGSDYPVVNFFMTYQQSLDAFRRHCDFVREPDRKAILGGTLKKLLDQAAQ